MEKAAPVEEISIAGKVVKIGDAAVPRLLEHLQDPDPARRRAASILLGRLESPASWQPLVGLLKDPDMGVKRAVIIALAKIDPFPSIPLIIPFLEDAEGEIQRSAVIALGTIGPKAVSQLLDLWGKAGSMLRKNSIDVFKAAGEAAADPLIEFFRLNPDQKEIGSVLFDLLKGVRMQARCLQLIEEPLPHIRLMAVDAVSETSSLSAVQALCRALSDPRIEIRRAAVKGLGKMKRRESVPDLISALKDPDAEIRLNAVDALGWIADPQAVKPLLEILSGKDESLVPAAAASLGRLKDPEAIVPVTVALKKGRISERTALYVLQEFGDRSISRLDEAITGSSYEEASYLSWVLIRFGKPGIERMILHLDAAEAAVRFHAARQLCNKENWGENFNSFPSLYSQAMEKIDLAAARGDLAAIAGAALHMISQGQMDSIPVLIQALEKHGDRETAQVMIDSGREQLEAAALQWAKKRGYFMMKTSKTGSLRNQWGGAAKKE